MKRLLVCAVLFGLAPGARAQAPDVGTLLFSASAKSDWRTGPDGVARMNLVGDSMATTGLAVFRLRYPAAVGDSTRATVNFHLGTEHIIVLKGTLVIGFGDHVDYHAVKEYGPEGFVVIPSGKPYYAWTRGETEIQVEAAGASRTIPWPHFTQRPARAQAAAVVDSSASWPNGLAPWTGGANGNGRMNLVGSQPPSTTELIAYRLHFAPKASTDSTRITYHYHFGTEHITILKGTLYIGFGDHLDKSKAKAYGPGSFIENPAGNPHYEWFGGDVIAHIEGMGSMSAVPLDPATGQPR